MPEIEISVEQHHIQAGKRGNCVECPVALALAEQLKLSKKKMRVGCFSLYLWNEDQPQQDPYYQTLPSEVMTWIDKFDTGKEVKCFKFKLEIPDEYIPEAS